MGNEDIDRKLVERLAESSFREQRASRRWGVFFKLFFFGYVIALTVLFYQEPPDFIAHEQPHAAVIEINGVINPAGDNDAWNVNALLREAFEADAAKGVILRINSPGGSPVESNRIYEELIRLRGKYPEKKVYAVAGDLCASGGYYIAAGADEIYVDKNSVIGSIGVILAGFGFVEAIEKFGVERRVQTAGGNKSILDPFLPLEYGDEARMTSILNAIHENFKTAVREGRGARLSGNPDVFSGAVFSASRGVELGLADGYGDTDYVAREVIGVDELVSYSSPHSVVDGLIDRFGVMMSDVLQVGIR